MRGLVDDADTDAQPRQPQGQHQPVGPAPTMRTSVSFSVTETLLIQYGIQGGRGLLCFRPSVGTPRPSACTQKATLAYVDDGELEGETRMKVADDDNAAVTQVLTDYYSAFSTLDAQAVLRYFHEPSQLVSPAGVVPTPTRAAVAAAFQPVMEGLRSRSFAKSELINLHLKRLSVNTVIAGASPYAGRPMDKNWSGSASCTYCKGQVPDGNSPRLRSMMRRTRFVPNSTHARG